MYFIDEKLYKKSIGVGEQCSFSIYNFGEALSNLMSGHDVERNNTRLRIVDKTIMRVVGTKLCPWLPTHKDILANDWKVIRIGN